MVENRKEMITSLRVDSELWKEAKVQAIRHDMTLTKLIEEALKKWIKEHEGKQK